MAQTQLGPEERRAKQSGKFETPSSAYGPRFKETRKYQAIELEPGKISYVDPEVAYGFSYYQRVFPGFSTYFILDVAKSELGKSTPATPGQISVIAARYGIPASQIEARFTGGAKGTGGVSKANQIQSLSAFIKDEAAKLGIAFSPEQVVALATMAQAQNFSTEQVIDELTKDVDFFRLNAGEIKTNYEQFKTMGKKYLVNLSDASVQDWALKISRGEVTQETVMQSIREAAKIANPWLADYIDKGLTPEDVLAGNRDFIAAGLELDPTSFDLMDQKTLNMMTVMDERGQRRLASQTELTANIRNDSRWRKTKNANELTSGMASMLAQIFGRSAF